MMQAVVYALGIYFENAVEVFLTRCLGRSYVGDAGVVDKYVNGEKLSRLPNNWRNTLNQWYVYWQDEKSRRKKVEDSVPTT